MIVFPSERRAKLRRIAGSNSRYRAAARGSCAPPGGAPPPLPPGAPPCPCLGGDCELFPHPVCPPGQRLLYQRQLNCSWIGLSRENFEAGLLPGGRGYQKALRPAERTASFVGWLWDRWGVNAYTWGAVGWQPCGNFGVAAALVLERPRAAYLRALRELERGGFNGGMQVMYYERAWRAIFALPPEEVVGEPVDDASAEEEEEEQQIGAAAGWGEGGNSGSAAPWWDVTTPTLDERSTNAMQQHGFSPTAAAAAEEGEREKRWWEGEFGRRMRRAAAGGRRRRPGGRPELAFLLFVEFERKKIRTALHDDATWRGKAATAKQVRPALARRWWGHRRGRGDAHQSRLV